jgi:hypothetical protein
MVTVVMVASDTSVWPETCSLGCPAENAGIHLSSSVIGPVSSSCGSSSIFDTLARNLKSLPNSQSIAQVPDPSSIQCASPLTEGEWALAGAAIATAPARPMNAPARTAVVRRNGDLSRFTRTPVTEDQGVRSEEAAIVASMGAMISDDASPRRRPAARSRLQQRMTLAISVNLGNVSAPLKGVDAHPRSSLN